MKVTRGVLVAFLLASVVFSPTHAGMNGGPVAYWPFNGNANDESGNGNNGIVIDATLTTDRFENPLSAYSFNGVNSRIVLSSLFHYSPINLTLHAWVKYDNDAPERKMIIAKLTGGDTSGNLALEIRGCFIAMQFNLGDGFDGWHQAVGTTPLASDCWYHVAATYDGSRIKVFLNGVLDGSTAYSQGMGAGSIPWMIGVHPSSDGGFYGGFSFKGTIDDVGIYDYALSDEEIHLLYNNTLPPGPCDEIQAQLDEANARISLLQATNAQLQNQVNAVSQQIQVLSIALGRDFNNPGFTLPGATLQEQIQNLVNAIGQLNFGRRQALYKNLLGR
jgi:hypothetical protein